MKYKEFLLLEADENKVDNTKKKKDPPPAVKVIYSKKFKDIINTIMSLKTSNISKRLLEMEEKEKFFDVSYIDVAEEPDSVSFLPAARIERFKIENKPEEEYWTSKSRVKTKIGRFVKQILGSKFNDASIEKFASKFKSMANVENEAKNFELVSGNDIVYWYNYKHYASDEGTMGGSCMAGNEAGAYLNIYSRNPNQCKLLILKGDDKNKIKGRALVWKLTEPDGKIFLDRIYTNLDSDVNYFIQYAKKEGWIYKDLQKYGDGDIVDGATKKSIKMSVVLENADFDYYPYVDTLRYHFHNLNVLSNHHDGFDNSYHTLTDTGGKWAEFEDDDYYGDDDYDPMVHDGYNNVEIHENDAVWCEVDNGYCNREDAIHMAYNGTNAYPNSPHIVFSDYQNKYYDKKDCEFSKPLNSWVWNKYVVDVYKDKDKRQAPDRVHRFEANKTIGKVGDDWYYMDILKIVEAKKEKTDKGKVHTEYVYDFK